MTEYELVDSIVSYNSTMQAWLTVFVTVLTAYLITAHVAGKNLTRSQVIILNFLFLIYSFLFVFAVHSAGERCLELAIEVKAINPSRSIGLTRDIFLICLATMVVSIVVALKFMWDVRHRKSE
jgi:hypothetical protein